MSTVDEALAIGTQLHQAGRLAEAERAYRQVLSADPGHPHALHQLGLLALQARRFETAIELIGQAVRADGGQAAFHANLGEAHRHSGNAAGAEECFRRALKLQPRLDKAHGLLAIVLHEQGKLDEAAAALQHVLRQTPDDAAVWTRLGVVLEEQAKLAEAEACFRRALRSDGKAADVHVRLADVLGGQDRLEEAAASYRTALQLKPDYFEAHNNLATILKCQQRLEEAERHFQAAVQLKPDDPAPYVNLGLLWESQQRLDEAVARFRAALDIDPRCVLAQHSLGAVLRKQGKYSEAMVAYQAAIEIDPGYAPAHLGQGFLYRTWGQTQQAITCCAEAIRLDPACAEAYNNMGLAFADEGRHDDAIVNCRRAIELNPKPSSAYNNVAASLQALGRLEEAQQYFERALALEPGRAEHLFNMGIVLKNQTRVRSALDWYERALQAQPGYVQALYSRGLARLSLGQFAEGWADCEHRLELPPYDLPRFSQPLWDGSPLDGRRLLVHCEQGLGDTLQFIRYLPLVRSRGENVTVVADAPLVPLLARSGYGPLVSKDQPLPPFDVHARLMSLPHIFGTGLDSVPADVPYLSVEEARVERWREELKKVPGFKVGIAWQGSTKHPGDRLRSIPLQHYAPLAQVAGVRLFSLQIGKGAEQLSDMADRFDVVDLGAMFERTGADFSDTAAAMKCLNLVVTCDTAVAHLAGALGVPVWVALPLAPDWRWLYGRDDSPWYPTMRLFRQTRHGDWSGVFERIVAELHSRLEANTQPR